MRTFIFLMVFLSSSAIAEGAYHAYFCLSGGDMNACSKSCTDFQTTYDFKVNVSKAVVLMSNFQGGVQNTFSLDNCKVVDSENWLCVTSDKWGSSEKRMINGVFVSRMLDIYGQGGAFYCAKK